MYENKAELNPDEIDVEYQIFNMASHRIDVLLKEITGKSSRICKCR